MYLIQAHLVRTLQYQLQTCILVCKCNRLRGLYLFCSKLIGVKIYTINNRCIWKIFRVQHTWWIKHELMIYTYTCMHDICGIFRFLVEKKSGDTHTLHVLVGEVLVLDLWSTYDFKGWIPAVWLYLVTSDLMHGNQDPPCSIQLRTSFLTFKDSFMYHILEFLTATVISRPDILPYLHD